mmetsp:Transcript_17543/g.45170  ORF Transcript_17543/g.45170 Transcript_17543/m.45170 type:complete len:393 (-) Transcript_17543:63-1241(-)
MPAESALVASAASGAKPKARAKGKAKAKAKGKAKAKAKAGSKPLLAKGKAKAQEQRKARDLAASGVVVAVDKQAAPMAKSVAPHVPRNLMRSITATSGPAKGWKVTAWLQDITGHKVRAHDSMVRWQILAPCRTRKFGTFRSVQDEEGDGVYAQLYTAVRPELLRRISSRRQLLEGITRGPSALGSGQGITPPKRRKCSPPVEKERAVTPRRSVARPLRAALRSAPTELLATQLFTGGPQKAAAAPQMAPWSCDCEAHLRRHSRCAFGGNLQPSVVHLRDYMLIGRGETCDVVLNSRRTPQMISRCHAVLHKEEGAFALVDQGSLNGILINGDPVTGRRALAQGDVVTFGVPSAQPEFDYVFEERPHDGGADAGCKGVLGWEELAMAPTAAC